MTRFNDNHFANVEQRFSTQLGAVTVVDKDKVRSIKLERDVARCPRSCVKLERCCVEHTLRFGRLQRQQRGTDPSALCPPRVLT